MRSTEASPLELGFQALVAGQWQAARASFEAALQVRETPEALEGLSWAAWWLDDAQAVFTARESAFRIYRKSGNVASAARMATWLACDHLDFNGALAVAAGWLRRAGRLLEPLEPGPEHGWLAFHQGYIAHASGDSAAARELGVQAAQIGRRFGIPDLEMLGLALEGGALVACAQVGEGMRCLDEATATALEGEATVPISPAWAFCFLVSACIDVRDYRRAFEWCDRIAEFANRYSSRYMLGFCRSHYGAVHLCRGRWAEAEAELTAAAEHYARSRPALVADALVWLAELRRRQGRPNEVGQLLDSAGDWTRAQLCRAHLALDGGDALRAVELAERCLRQLPEDHSLNRAPVLEVLVHARIACGQLEEAASALEALRMIERQVGTTSLHACADLAEGALAAARGHHERARPLLEDAADAFERSGVPFEALQAKIELATSLLALGRMDVAERELRTALDRLRMLGAEMEAERAQRLLDTCALGVASSGPFLALSRREREVLCLLAEGLTNRQIAERLVVSEHTVHRHVTNILRKLDLPSRTAAAAHAIRAGLLESPTA